MNEMSDRVKSYYEQCRVDLTKRRALLLPKLKELGVTYASAQYDGGGDQGCVEVVTFRNESGPLDIEDIEIDGQSLEELMHDMTYDALTIHHDGWENCEGAYGDLDWSIETDTMDLNHNQRIIESEYSQVEL